MTTLIRNQAIRVIALAGLLGCGSYGHAAPQLEFLRSTDLDSIGLRLRLMHEAREKPLPAPTRHTYVFTTPNGTSKVEMYDPTDLWVADQHAGEWIDPAGNSLVLCVLRYHKPTGFERKHVPLEGYRQRVPQETGSQSWSFEDAARWVRTYVGELNAQLTESRTTNTRFKDIYHVDLPATNSPSFGYLFRLNPRSNSAVDELANWHFARFSLAPGTSLETALSDVRKKFLPYISPITIGGNTPIGPSTRFQDKASRPLDHERSAAYTLSRTQVANSIRNMGDWWFVETANYILLSNLDGRFRSMVISLQSDLETVRRSFDQLVPPRHRIDAVSVIRMFATQQEYADYVGKEYAWTVGLWYGKRKELVVRPVSGPQSTDEKELIKTTTYHEAFHQYLFYALNERPTAPWFNEGHAALYEHIELSGQGLRMKESDTKIEVVHTLIKTNALNLRTLVGVDYATFYGDNDETRAKSYSTAWALCYFLRKHAEQQKDSPYGAITAQYIEGVMKTGDMAKATEFAFNGVNMEDLQNDFIRFWSSSRDRERAERVRLFQESRP